MDYKINFNEWGSMFSIPASLVDNHIKICSDSQLKVILYILSHSNTQLKIEDISEYLSINENEVENAISFWIDRNILYTDEVLPIKNETTEVKPSKPVKKVTTITKPDSRYISNILRTDKNLALLLDEAQNVLKKTLSPSDMSTLVYLYDSHGLPCDVLILLMHYCSSVNKANIRQIEKIGLLWSEEQIYSLEAAEEKIKIMTDTDTAWNKVSKCFGIKNISKPTKNQLRFANTWINEWNFSMQMINEAYERCVDKKSVYDMSYINAILKRWNEKGIKTLEQLKKSEENGNFKKSKNSKKNKGSVYDPKKATYDLSKYENKSIFDED